MRETKAHIDDGWRIPDELWSRVRPLLPAQRPHPKGGRPWTDQRTALDGILYVLRTGRQWKALPREFGAASTVKELVSTVRTRRPAMSVRTISQSGVRIT